MRGNKKVSSVKEPAFDFGIYIEKLDQDSIFLIFTDFVGVEFPVL